MRKVAVILHRYSYDTYSDYDKIIEKITDFAEVTNEDYNLLVQASHEQGFQILEVPINQQEFIANTVADYLKIAKAEEEKRRKEEAKRKAQREEAKRKVKQKTEEAERKKLEELIKKHGIPQDMVNAS